MSFAKLFWKLIEPFHKQFYIFFVAITIYELMQMANSYFFSLGIKLVGDGMSQSRLPLFLVGILVFDLVYIWVDNNIDVMILSKIGYPIYRDLKSRALSHLLGLAVDWHNRNNSSVLFGKIQQGVDKVSSLASDIAWDFAPTTIQFLISLVPLVFLSPICVVVLLSVLPIYMRINAVKHRALEPHRRLRHLGYDQEWQVAAESVGYIELVTTSGLAGHFTSIHDGILDQIVDCAEKEAVIGIIRYQRQQMMVVHLARIIVLSILLLQLISKTLSVSEIVFVWTLVERLSSSFWRFGKLYDRAMDAKNSIERLDNLFEAETSVVESDNPIKVPEGPIEIDLSNVSFAHNGDGDTIRGVNLEIEAGETIAFVGSSGSGKSTLVKLLLRLFDINSGSITINGIDIRDAALNDLRRLFGIVSQDVPIFDDTIFNNIALGRLDATMDEIVQAAKMAGIHDFIANTNDGYDTLLGERGVRLSGGEKQRVAIARAILANPRVLILDEATSALDALTEANIMRAIQPLLSDPNRTVIIIAHRLATIRGADHIVVLDQGQIVEQGSHKELIKHGGLYAEMYNEQVTSLNASHI
ncbi:ABC transporter ATP-binding protein [candidate division WWE3 bacterium]|uniref:ABC transporter ATP-binding protein n=1 Tax=candidate division WWE3 bacterium TaxID=2053526 RepID=A0A955LKZ4_UNCKA|nr:ABC transporter ATP-binding protein [candidate division WWE3 bacterium]